MNLTAPNDTAKIYRADASRWLTAADIARLGEGGDIRHRFSFSRAERQAYRRRRYVKPSEWAPRERIMTEGMFAGSAMNMAITPYAGPIMDAAVQPYVRQVAICAAPQTAKTTIIHTILGWLAQFAPGPILGVYPKEVQGKEHMADRITGMFKQSPTLRKLLTWRKQDMTDTLLRLATLWWRIGWSGSAASLADRSARYIDAQEVDKYEDRPNKRETGVMELIKVRTRFFSHNYKIFYSSSPTVESGNIWMIISKETQAVFVAWVRCPHCLESQVMEFTAERWWWPHDEDGHSVDRKEILARKLARYICRHCAAEWTDHDRNQAIQHIVFRHVEDLRMLTGEVEMTEGEEIKRYMQAHRPASIGFILPSWISYQVSLSEVAHDFLRAQDKELSPEERFKAYQDFQNKQRALPWRIEQQSRDVAEILALRDERPAGAVPGNGQACSLVFGVDTQDNGFYYVVLAVGFGFINEQWVVRAGFVQSFAALARVLWEDEYKDSDGERYVVEFGLQDMLGHRTREVIDFCLEHDGRVLPSAGVDNMSQPYAFTNKEYFPGTDQPIRRGGMRAVRVNTKYYKDNLSIKLGVAPDDPGGIHLHSEIGEEFARHLIAEVRNPKGIWEQIGSRPNHWWDCLCLANCAADFLGLKYRGQEAEPEPERKKAAEKERRARW